MSSDQMPALSMYLNSSFHHDDEDEPQRNRAARYPVDLTLMGKATDYVRTHPGATSPEIARATGVSNDKALRHLDELRKEEKVFWVAGQGKSHHYYFRPFFSGGHEAGHWKYSCMNLRHFPRTKAVYEVIVKQVPRRLSELYSLTRAAGIDRHVARSAVVLLDEWGVIQLEQPVADPDDRLIITDPRIYCEECDYFVYAGGYGGYGAFLLAYYDSIYNGVPLPPSLVPGRREAPQPAFENQNRRVIPADQRAWIEVICGGPPQIAIFELDAVRQFGPRPFDWGGLKGGKWAKSGDSKSPTIHYWLPPGAKAARLFGRGTSACSLRLPGTAGGMPARAGRPKHARACVDCIVVVLAARWDAGERGRVSEWLDGFPNPRVSNAVRYELRNYGIVT